MIILWYNAQMNKQDLKAFQNIAKLIAADKASAIAFLIRVGILDEDCKLTENYE